jgi:hypothetical protein
MKPVFIYLDYLRIAIKWRRHVVAVGSPAMVAGGLIALKPKTGARK